MRRKQNYLRTFYHFQSLVHFWYFIAKLVVKYSCNKNHAMPTSFAIKIIAKLIFISKLVVTKL